MEDSEATQIALNGLYGTLSCEERSEEICRSCSESRKSLDAEFRNERIASVLDITRPDGCVRSLVIIEEASGVREERYPKQRELWKTITRSSNNGEFSVLVKSGNQFLPLNLWVYIQLALNFQFHLHLNCQKKSVKKKYYRIKLLKREKLIDFYNFCFNITSTHSMEVKTLHKIANFWIFSLFCITWELSSVSGHFHLSLYIFSLHFLF